MKVLFISSSFPRPERRGYCPYNLSLCAALARVHSVTAVVPVPWVEFPWHRRTRVLEPSGVDVHYRTYFYVPRFGRNLQATCMSRGIRRAVFDAAREAGPPDWILSYWTYPDSAAALELSRAVASPIIAMAGGSDVLLARKGTPAWQRVSRTLLDVDHVITVSADLASRIHTMGVPERRITVMPRGVDTDVFRPADTANARARLGLPVDTPMFLWVGRIDPVKDLHTLIRAARQLTERGRTFSLYLIGDGAERASVERNIVRFGLANRVHVVGAIGQDQLPLWYQAADAFVLPSLSEGTPNVLLEALACGKPLIASAVGGIPDLTDPRFDELVPPRDEAALASALDKRIVGRSTPRPVPPFLDSWDAVAAVISQRAEEVIKQRQGSVTLEGAA